MGLASGYDGIACLEGGREHALVEVGNKVTQPAGLVRVRIVQGEGGGEDIQASFSWGLCFLFIRHDLERVSGIWEEKTEEWEKARERDGYIAFVFACPFPTAVLFGVCTVDLGEKGASMGRLS